MMSPMLSDCKSVARNLGDMILRFRRTLGSLLPCSPSKLLIETFCANALLFTIAEPRSACVSTFEHSAVGNISDGRRAGVERYEGKAIRWREAGSAVDGLRDIAC